MAAEFEVSGGSIDPARELLILTGTVTAGMVHPGMTATPDGSVPGFPTQVHGVEFVARAPGAPDALEPALTFHFRAGPRLEELGTLDWSHAKLSLSF